MPRFVHLSTGTPAGCWFREGLSPAAVDITPSRAEAGRDSPQSRDAGPRRRPSPVHFACSRAPQHPAARGTAGSGWAALPWGHRGESGHRVSHPGATWAPSCNSMSGRPHFFPSRLPGHTGRLGLSLCSVPWAPASKPARFAQWLGAAQCSGGPGLCGQLGHWVTGAMPPCSHLENEDHDNCASVRLRTVVSIQPSSWKQRALGEAPENGVLSQHLCHCHEGWGAAAREIRAQACLSVPGYPHC